YYGNSTAQEQTGGRPASLRQRPAARLGRQPDEPHPQQIDRADERAGRRVAGLEDVVADVNVHLEQRPGLERPDGGQDAPEVEAEALPGGPDARREQLGQV